MLQEVAEHYRDPPAVSAPRTFSPRAAPVLGTEAQRVGGTVRQVVVDIAQAAAVGIVRAVAVDIARKAAAGIVREIVDIEAQD